PSIQPKSGVNADTQTAGCNANRSAEFSRGVRKRSLSREGGMWTPAQHHRPPHEGSTSEGSKAHVPQGCAEGLRAQAVRSHARDPARCPVQTWSAVGSLELGRRVYRPQTT